MFRTFCPKFEYMVLHNSWFMEQNIVNDNIDFRKWKERYLERGKKRSGDFILTLTLRILSCKISLKLGEMT